jgi:GAF domain-containing protein
MSNFCPYRGLEPFREEDNLFFFGREEDIETVASNVLGARLTVLYGPSGVGKSSLLQAGVAPLLRTHSHTQCVIFRDWQRPRFESRLSAQIERLIEGAVPGGRDQRINETLRKSVRRSRATIAVLLDQFEDYFNIASDLSRFEARLASVVNDWSLDVHFLFSVRQDSLSELDRFRFRIPDILGNILRLDHLDRNAAERAIRGPLRTYNIDRPIGAQVEIEDRLVATLLDQVQTRSIQPTKSGNEIIRERNLGDRIEAPYLQLALTRIWEEESKIEPTRLRFETLMRLGGAQRIAHSHLERVLNTLDEMSQEACSRIFDRMVTPTGASIAYKLSDLAAFAGITEKRIQPTLAKLSSGENRILSAVGGAFRPGDETIYYQIFHDVLIQPILSWRERRERHAQLEKQKREVEQEATRKALECIGEIERASARLLDVDEVLKSLCNEVTERGFDFATVQLVDRAEKTIQTVASTGLNPEWYTISKHSLEDEPGFRDIMADVVLNEPPTVEIIAGWDDRFDEWIYNAFSHKNMVRAFVPIVVSKDAQGKAVNPDLNTCRWDIVRDKQDGENSLVSISIRSADLTDNGITSFEVIGVVEAGYNDRRIPLSPESAIALFKLVARRAADLRSTSLVNVLQTVADSALKMVAADSSSVYFQSDVRQPNVYVYETWAGERMQPPRRGGQGERAITDRKPLFLPDPNRGQDERQVSRSNPRAYDAGVRAYAAIPLFMTGQQLGMFEQPEKLGILYVYFKTSHRFTDEEKRWLMLFVNRATDAINYSLQYAQALERTRRLATLHNIAMSLAEKPSDPGLLYSIAGNARNIFGADVVTIFEYDELIEMFPSNPNIAGRLKQKQQAVIGQLSRESAPYRLVRHGRNCGDIYESMIRGNEVLYRKATRDELNFADRENIESSAGIILKIHLKSKTSFGVMFISYRRPHMFNPEEQWLVQLLARMAAVAIRNRRLLSQERAQPLVAGMSGAWDQESG